MLARWLRAVKTRHSYARSAPVHCARTEMLAASDLDGGPVTAAPSPELADVATDGLLVILSE